MPDRIEDPRILPARTARRLALTLAVLLAGTAATATAFQGPYASVVTGAGGYQMDLDVRWPDGTAPAGGWPVVFFAHGAGGNKTSSANVAGRYADDGYVTLTWTNRSTATDPSPQTLATDQLALKSWLVNDFQAEAGVTAPVNPAKFGIAGGSLGGYTSWAGGLLTNNYAAISPNNWGISFFGDGIVLNGSIDRITGGPRASTLPTPYDSAGLDAAFDAVMGTFLAARGTVTIPVMMQNAFLDARTGGTYAMRDYDALTSTSGKYVYIGTGGHGTPDTDDTYRGDLRERWFAHWLKDEDNGIDAQLPIDVALIGTNERLAYASWPPPDSHPATLWLRAPGTLAPTPPTAPGTPATIANDPGSLTWTGLSPNFPPNQIRNNMPRNVVAWQSAPLTADALLLGTPSVRLELSGTGSRYQVNVHLYDQADGEDPLLLATTSATVASPSTVIDVALGLTGRRVPAGHRLRLEVTNRDDQDLDYTNGYAPATETLRHIPFLEYSDTQIFHDVVRPSSLTLPLVGRDALPLPGVACDAARRSGCRLPTVAGASPLTLKNDPVDARDTLTWKWTKGSTTAFAELGDPTTDDAYAFCLYDGTSPGGALLLQSRAPAAGLCGTKPCWQQVGSSTNPKGFKYTDKEQTPDGLKKLQVLAGEAPKAKAIVSGKGESLGGAAGVPALPLPLPLVAQLQTADGCWEVTYGAAQLNGPTTFKAK